VHSPLLCELLLSKRTVMLMYHVPQEAKARSSVASLLSNYQSALAQSSTSFFAAATPSAAVALALVAD
jgi:hypothetical protein